MARKKYIPEEIIRYLRTAEIELPSRKDGRSNTNAIRILSDFTFFIPKNTWERYRRIELQQTGTSVVILSDLRNQLSQLIVC